ncbi:cobalamin biosynthesis protein [Parendozoicomonas haliclonae]|uniref:Cobalamin biosynthesis protein CbiG n=1 Tax=Parendozoicomonas haliclonae TaxID=1960125 RepID=A0A1X7ANG0_9GAMM|nr:cobalamin biosynthesis protein [Parendozoicomonas haliclonae]SMA49683.1 cobalamin biosynthesis protein CbiG [Parendozoicomonas haliclonae]
MESTATTGQYVIGIGSERGTPLEVVGQGIMQCLDQYDIEMGNVACIASVHMKAHDPAFKAFARIHEVPLITCNTQEMKAARLKAGCGARQPWFTQDEVSRLSALYFSGASQLMYPPFYFFIGHNHHRITVSVCKVLRYIPIKQPA